MNQYTPVRKCQDRAARVVKLGRLGRTQLSISKELGEHLTNVRRWLKRAGITAPLATKDVGDEGEKLVVEKLQEMGLPAELMPHGHPFDVLCGAIRIEVKTAAAMRTRGVSASAGFHTAPKRNSLYGNVYQKDYAESCDFVVFVWLGNDEYPENLWVCSSEECPAGATIALKYSRNTRWAKRQGALHLIQEAFEKGGSA